MGIVCAILAIVSHSNEHAGGVISWILPFSSGGFLYISMINILPELLGEKDPITSIKQIISMTFGIFVIYGFSLVFD